MNIEHIRRSLQRKGLYICFQEACKRLLPIRWVGNLDIMNQIYDLRAYRRLKRKYMQLLDKFEPKAAIPGQETRKIIWICWLQGEESAPNLVKKCIASIRQFAKDYEVCIITQDNVNQYVEIPEFIRRRLEKKQMMPAHFSDYIRLALLEKYGGIWIDATVLLTSPIPDDVASAPFFCFQKSSVSKSPMPLSNWFFVSEANHWFIQMTKYLLEEYWKREKHVRHYLFFHLLFALVIDYNETTHKMWSEMPYYDNVAPLTLLPFLFKPFDTQKFERFCKNSFAHKLTYKYFNFMGADTEAADTFYGHIMCM